jgi:hypothetical protein
MKTKILFASLCLGLGLAAAAFSAPGGPPPGKGNARPDTAPNGNPDDCPYIVNGECPGGQAGCPEDCPRGDGACPKTECPAGNDSCPNPDAQPKRDGSGGPGKPANPSGPQDGSAPGKGGRGGRG